ncbi:MAG: polyprenyl synthetase family protein [Candidatus Diapherotrites archaeon]
MESIEEYLGATAKTVEARLESFFPKKLTRAWLEHALGAPKFYSDEKTCNSAVAEPIWDFLSRGGKRWRPALMLLCCEAVGGNPDEIGEFVVLPELLHNGTIMVDDVEDNAELRRGRPCTHKIYGEDLAINDANLLYYLPTILLYRNTKNLGCETRVKIYGTYAEEMLRLSFGQAMDIYWHGGKGGKITEQQYLQMCIYKTGTLASFAAKLGAILGNAQERQVTALGNFAATLGVAFQIRDDVLNLFPNKGWGKETGEDVREGKRSLPAIYALEHASPKQAKRLAVILDSGKNTKAEVKEAIKIIGDCGSVEYSRKTAARLVSEAWSELAPSLSESPAKQRLKEFADYLVKREI